MKAPTKTQLMIAQELARRDCQPMVTTQDEYLKFGSLGKPGMVLWVSRRGELRIGQRLPRSKSLSGLEWRGLKKAAKANYKGE